MQAGKKAQAPFEAVRSKDAVIRTLRRAGVLPETIAVLQRQLPNPVDLDRDGNLLLSYGITMDRLIDRFGGSP
jgi:hypothetical protein